MRTTIACLILRVSGAFMLLWVGIEQVFQGVVPPGFEEAVRMIAPAGPPVQVVSLVAGIMACSIGVLLLLGLLTRFFALCGLIAAGAGVVPALLAGIYDGMWIRGVLLAGICIAIVLLGSGGLSIDSALRRPVEE